MLQAKKGDRKARGVTTTCATVLPGHLVVIDHKVEACAAIERTFWSGGNVSKPFTDATRNGTGPLRKKKKLQSILNHSF